MSPTDLKAKVRAVMAANRLNEFTALRYLQQLGASPEKDDTGKVIVRDELGRELARVIVPENIAESPGENLTAPKRTPAEAQIVIRDGQPLAVVEHSGRYYAIETKPTLLDMHIAAMRPLKADFADDYAAPIDFRACLSADPENGRLADETLNHFTHNPIIVALARRFYVLVTLDEAEEGPISITSADIGA